MYADDRIRDIAEQAAQEWERADGDTYERGFASGVHMALTMVASGGSDISPELAGLIDRLDARERRTIRHHQLSAHVGWHVHSRELGWGEIATVVEHTDSAFVYTDKFHVGFTGEVTVMAPFAFAGEPA